MTKVIEIFKKISRTPSWIMVILVMVSYFFADAYAILWDAEVMMSEFMEAGYVTGSSGYYMTMVCIVESLIGVVLFELLISIIYRTMSMRRMVNNNKNFFVQTARAIYIASNIIVGLYSLIYFAYPDIYSIGYLIFNYIVQAGALTFAFFVLSWSVINPLALKDAFFKLYLYYFVILGIFTAFSLLLIVTDGSSSTSDIILYAVRLALIIGSGLLAQFVLGKRIKTRCESYIPPQHETVRRNPYDNMQDISDVFTFNNNDIQSGQNFGEQSESKDNKDNDDEIFTGHGF